MMNKTGGSPSRRTQSPDAMKYGISPTSPYSQQHSRKQWHNTIQKIAPAVLAMEMMFTRAFDGASAYQSNGTAFVVDKKLGIALTNQHCASEGPATFTARFISGEQVPAHRIYTSPLYDFAFMRFDPSLIEYTEVAEIELYPEGAQPGTEILVVGNDSGEKFLTCHGIIDKLEYLEIHASEQNAFYTKASVVVEGGGSGSPVVDINGKAVGLNANGVCGFAGFVPLDKVVRVLEKLKNGFDNYGNWRGVYIPTKTLGALICHITLEEIKEEGNITEKDSSWIAEKYGENLFRVESSHMLTELDELEEDDLVLELNGIKLGGDLVEVETILHEIDEEDVTIIVARNDATRGGLQKVKLKLKVVDMEEHKPDKILDMSGSSIYTASYRSALRNKIDVGDLVVDEPGACLEAYIGKTSVLTSINRKNITSFNSFVRELESSVSCGINLRLGVLKDLQVTARTTEREFYQWLSLAFVWTLNKDKFKWTRKTFQLKRAEDINYGIASLSAVPNNEDPYFSLTRSYPANYKANNTCLVGVSLRLHDYIHNISNVQSCEPLWGTGIVIYQSSQIGIILATQQNVPLIVGRAKLYFPPGILLGNVFFVDANHGFSLIYYDPIYLRNYADQIQPAKLSPKPLAINDAICLLCNDRKSQNPGSVCSRVIRVNKEFDNYRVDTDIGCEDITHELGLVLDNDFQVKGLFRNITNSLETLKIYSLPSILEPVELLMKSMLEDPRSLCYGVRFPVFQAKLLSVPVEDAIKLGLTYGWVNRILNKPNSQRRFLMVKYCLPESNAAKSLEREDLILSINGQQVCSMEDLDFHLFGESDLNIRILRDGMEQNVWVEREFISKPQWTSVVFWCGLLVQDTPRDLDFNKGFTPTRGVVVNTTNSFEREKPCELCDGCCWITEVDGIKVRNLDEFVEVTSKFENSKNVQCKMIAWNGNTIAFNCTVDYLHFPTIELTFDELNQLWHQKEISPQWRS